MLTATPTTDNGLTNESVIETSTTLKQDTVIAENEEFIQEPIDVDLLAFGYASTFLRNLEGVYHGTFYTNTIQDFDGEFTFASTWPENSLTGDVSEEGNFFKTLIVVDPDDPITGGLPAIPEGSIDLGESEYLAWGSWNLTDVLVRQSLDARIAFQRPDASQASPSESALIGTWINTETESDLLAFTFFADGTYVHAQVDADAPEGTSGMEWGPYSLAQSTGRLTVSQTIDNNGESGLSDIDAAFVAVDGDTLTLSVDEPDDDDIIDVTLTFRKVNTVNDVVGTWVNTETENDLLAFIFFDDGTYIHAEVDQDDADEISGMEWGTYSIDSNTGQLTVTQTFDGNGDTGLTDIAEGFENGFAAADADTLTLSFGDGSLHGRYTFDARGYSIEGNPTTEEQMATLSGNDATLVYAGEAYATHFAEPDTTMDGTFSSQIAITGGNADIRDFDISVSSANHSASITNAVGHMMFGSEFIIFGGDVLVDGEPIGAGDQMGAVGSLFGPTGESIGGIWYIEKDEGLNAVQGLFVGDRQ